MCRQKATSADHLSGESSWGSISPFVKRIIIGECWRLAYQTLGNAFEYLCKQKRFRHFARKAINSLLHFKNLFRILTGKVGLFVYFASVPASSAPAQPCRSGRPSL
jgi:hypothetical protein